MFWILVFAALAAHVSCAYDYTGTLVLTQHDFCSLNKVRRGSCESTFQNYLVANPHIERCSPDSPFYSNNCETLPFAGRPSASVVDHNNVHEESPTNARLGASTAGEKQTEYPVPSGQMHKKVMSFTLDLFKSALPSGFAQNYVLSPLLVQSLLANLITGASNVTRHEMEAVLQLTEGDQTELRRALEPSREQGALSKNKLDFASQIFRSTQIELLHSYQKTLKGKNLNLQPMDFSNTEYAARTINDWVKEKTRDKITEIVDAQSLNPETQLLLLNALYFNGTWMYKFSNKTERGAFYLTETKQNPVNMMSLTRNLRNGYTAPEQQNDGFLWVELPYLGDTLSMILLLPKERFQLDRELRKFSVKELELILAEIDANDMSEVKVQLPEFKAESTVSFVEPLKQMGLASMFDSAAPFDRLSNDIVKISEVKQKSFLTVNPHGTVATSVTFATVIPLSLSRSTEFFANQPFAAIIMDKANKLPLFIAKICQPEKFKNDRSGRRT